MISPFCSQYLQAQGVEIIAPKPQTRAIKERREPEFVPVTVMYERQ